jgi:hypothetical protein
VRKATRRDAHKTCLMHVGRQQDEGEKLSQGDEREKRRREREREREREEDRKDEKAADH